MNPVSFPIFALIGDLGGPELLLIFVLVLVLFGGKRLPDFARGLGRSIREFKKATSGVEEEIKRAMEEPPPPPRKPQALPAPQPAPPVETHDETHAYESHDLPATSASSGAGGPEAPISNPTPAEPKPPADSPDKPERPGS